MWFLLSTVITSASNFLLGLLIYRRNPKNPANITFFFLTFSLAIWIATLYLYYVLVDPHWVLFIGRLNYAAPTLSIFCLFHFLYIFPEKTYRFHPILEWFTRVFTVLLVIITVATPLIDKNEIIAGPERVVEFGLFYPLWILYYISLVFTGIALLIYKLRTASQAQQTQLKYFFAAIAITLFFASITNILLPTLFSYYGLQTAGPVATLALTSITAYAIIRHKFLDITAIVARAVSYTIFVFIVVLFEVFFVVGLTYILPDSIDRTFAIGFGAVVIVIGYDLLRKYINQITEKIFFQGRYDTEEVLAQLTHTMASEIDIKKLCLQLLTTIAQDMRIIHGAFVLIADNQTTHTESVNWPSASRFGAIDWCGLIDSTQELIVFEELEDGPVKDLFRQHEITIAIPLKIKNKDIGLLLLGPKASGDIYADRDLELLSIFAPQAAVAVNNAKAYQEIQKFSKTLEKKVEERTAELESTQREKLAKARELLKIKDEFVFIATHDLATPVTALRGFVQLLQETPKKLPKDIKFDIDSIGEATERLKTLVEDLLEVARGESGTIKVELAKTNLAQVLTQSEELVQRKAQDRKVKFTLKLDKKAQFIMADEHKLREVVENLFTNAIKYNHDGGKIDVVTKVDGDRVVFTVADTGIGIPAKEQTKVFTKFYRSESDEARMQSGTGLGLFVVQMLVTKMKGTIKFSSKEGEGTTFTLTFLKC